MSPSWQASATYTLSKYEDGQPAPWSGVMNPLRSPCRRRSAKEYGLAATDQRPSRPSFNGIWQAAYGLQLSGLYFYGSGQRFATTYGGDALDTGGTVGSAGRVRRSAVGSPHRATASSAADSSRRHPTAEALCAERRRGVDGIVEVFQSVQPRELRVVHDRRKQRTLRAAVIEHERGVSAADGAGGFRFTYVMEETMRRLALAIAATVALVAATAHGQTQTPPV
jgi:hypothetical protein